jgi:predicted permease
MSFQKNNHRLKLSMPSIRPLSRSIKALMRAPAFAVVSILVLAAGISIATLIFTMADEFLFNPFPYQDPKQVVVLWESNPAFSGLTAERVPATWNNFDAWQLRNRSFQGIEAYEMFMDYNLSGLDRPEQVAAARATPGFFSMLGVNAALGRTFLAGDNIDKANSIALISYNFAKTHFAHKNPLGQSLLLNGAPRTIIGVLPEGFHLPALFEGVREYKPDLWVPLPKPSAVDPAAGRRRFLRVCGRLKFGVSIAQAKEDMNNIAGQLAREDPEFNRGYGVSIFSLDAESIDPDLRNDLRALSAAALFVLLLACTNLAGLMLTRSAGRKKDLAIMAALGANRWSLMTPTLNEGFVLALIAFAASWPLAVGGVHLVAAIRPIDMHSAERLSINGHAFIFAICVSLLTMLVFGLVPAWLITRNDLSDAIRSTPSTRMGTPLARNAILALQIAAAVSFGIAATLLTRSFQRLLDVDLGFRPQRLLTAHVSLSPQRYPTASDRNRFCIRLRESLRSIPEIQSTALADSMPLYSIVYSSFEIEGRPVEQRSAAPSSDVAHVTPDFLATMNIPLVEGRVFTEQEAEQDPPAVAVVNQSLARRYWPKGDAVGSHIRELPLGRAPGPWQTVIGIVGDFRQNSVETPPRPELMWPARTYQQMTVVLQTANANPSSIGNRLEQAVWKIDREQAVAEIQPVEQAIADNNSQRRFNMLAIRSFAGFSMLLTLVGLFGLISSLIASRFRDLAIRLALGAPRTQVCLSLLRTAFIPISAGIAFGLLLSYLAKQLIAAILFQTSPLDPATYVATPAGILVILLVTSLAATIRAARIDPAKVLRES